MEENIERTKPPEDELPIDAELRRALEEIENLQKRVAFIRKHREALKSLPRPAFITGGMDFDNLPHAEVVKVIRTIGGKWDKRPADNNTIHYESRDKVDGFKVRCYKGEPPPSCKIVEVEEHVPETVIPAHTKKVRKMVCHPERRGAVARVAPARAPLEVQGDVGEQQAQIHPAPDY